MWVTGRVGAYTLVREDGGEPYFLPDSLEVYAWEPRRSIVGRWASSKSSGDDDPLLG